MSDEPVWLTRSIVIALHTSQISEHGGQPGLRDEGLLDSALARPLNQRGYAPESDLATYAAQYGFGLARNHPFVDGNKRIAFVTMAVFLMLNDHGIEAEETEVVDVMLRLAEGTMDELALESWLRSRIVRK